MNRADATTERPAWLRAVPNGISVFRLALGVAFPWLPVEWRVPAVAAAAVSDWLDGFSARLLRLTSDVGRLLDPVADKVFVFVLGLTLVREGAIGLEWALLVASRDLVVLAGVAWSLRRGERSALRDMRPSWLGKAATAAQFALLLALVAYPAATPFVLGPAAALSVLAAGDYARRFSAAAEGPSPRSAG